MKFRVFAIIGTILTLSSVDAAYQYNVKGNQGWLTFDSETTVAFDVDRSGKDNNKENFIDRGNGVADYGWYNLDTDEAGSFNNGASATFSENDRIGLWVKDNAGNVYLSSKPPQKSPDNVIWGKARIIEENIAVAGGNFGSNGTHEYYVFKVNTNNTNGNTPSGQPLPGIIATLLVGGGTLLYLKKRKKLYSEA